MERSVLKTLQMTYILLIIGISTHAQPAIVTEIPNGSRNLTTIGDLVYFISGDSLLRTDGTETGTILLKSGFTTTPNSFTEFNDMLVFKTSPNELWRSNGTPSGTIQLTSKTAITILQSTPSYLFFSASDASTGKELYRTDGTPGGTVLVKDIFPGSGDGYRGASAVLGNEIFFAGNNGTNGMELWKSNGTSSGTVMVKDILPGAGNGYGGNAFSHNNLVYFAGNTIENGVEPWVSDGTAAGTQLLKDITPGPESTWGIQFAIGHNEWVYFLAGGSGEYSSSRHIWKTSGSTASTTHIKRIVLESYRETFDFFQIYHNKVYFFEDNEIYDYLWVTDGSAAGTHSIFQFAGTDGHVTYADVVNDYLLFTGYSSAYPMPLYRSDGTTDGTQGVFSFKSSSYGRFAVDVTTSGDYAFYADHDGFVDAEGGMPLDQEDYNHLFQTDALTRASMRTLYGTSTVGTREIVDYNGKVIFTTRNVQNGSTDRQTELWFYDPSIPPQPTAHFTLIDARSDEDVRRMTDGMSFTIDHEEINIRYNPVGTPGSVVFKINDVTARTETAAPYTLAGDVDGDYATWEGAQPGKTYKLTATEYSGAGGSGTPGESLTITFTIECAYWDEDCMAGPPCTASGVILREQWNNVAGNNVSAIPVNSRPSNTRYLGIFEGPTNSETNFGARIRGYLCPPTTGNYTFWIASNDNSELWLSTDDNPSNKVKIASVTGATTPRQWTKFPTQKSTAINLTAGKRYYIEALHKQGAGSHNIAVGWQLPDGTLERPIPGSRLSPSPLEHNHGPVVTITRPAEGQTFTAPAAVTLEATATDQDGSIAKVEFFEGPNKLGEDLTSPYSFTWQNVPAGNYNLSAKATDGEGATGFAYVSITVREGAGCTASGTITRDYWANVSGARVSDIPVNSPPTSTSQINIFEGPSNIGSNYATRIRGYLCPPATGNYTFWIASNDHSELWLSTDDNPANKIRIASVIGATGIREWTRYASQQSAPIALTQGKRYYIEALHKQGTGSDNIAVGWRLPNGTLERPIPGNRLSPFEMNSARMASADDDKSVEKALYSQINIYPNPVQSGDPALTIAGYERVEEPVETHIEIINMTGEVLFADRILCGGNCSSYLMNINKQLVPGVYLVNMKTKDTRLSKRLLVK